MTSKSLGKKDIFKESRVNIATLTEEQSYEFVVVSNVVWSEGTLV